MFKHFLIIAVLFSLLSCSKEERTVINQLELDDVSSLIEQEPLYETVIKEIENSRDKLNKDLVSQNKFKDLTYKHFLEYKKLVFDDQLMKNIKNKAIKKHNADITSLIESNKLEIDKFIKGYKKEYDKTNPENFLKIEFLGIENNTNTNTWSRLKSRITPLQNFVEYAKYEYIFTNKDDENKKIIGTETISSYTGKPKISVCDIFTDYGMKLKGLSTAQIINEYNIEYNILAVKRYEFHTINFESIPNYILSIIKKNSTTNEDYLYLIEDYLKIELPSLNNYIFDLWDAEKQKINLVAYEFERYIGSVY